MIHALKTLVFHLGHVLALYGGWGLFLVNFLDSSFLAFPVLNDLLLLHLSAQHPDLWVYYAAQATAGSVAGNLALYGLSRGGRKLLRRNHKPARESPTVDRWLERNDFVTMVVGSLLPPPMPFKVVTIAAGALQVDAGRVTIGLIVGRGLRFFAEALVGMRYGVAAEDYLRHHLALLSVLTAVMIVGFTVLYRRLRSTVTVES